VPLLFVLLVGLSFRTERSVELSLSLLTGVEIYNRLEGCFSSTASRIRVRVVRVLVMVQEKNAIASETKEHERINQHEDYG
jgi:hypothetical protein